MNIVSKKRPICDHDGGDYWILGEETVMRTQRAAISTNCRSGFNWVGLTNT